VEDAEAGMSCIDRSRPGGSLLLRVDGVRGVTPGRRRWIVRHARDDARYQLSLVLTGANLCILPTDKCTPRPGAWQGSSLSGASEPTLRVRRAEGNPAC